MEEYYKPLELKFGEFLVRHNNSQTANQIIDLMRDEIRKYNQYKAYYNYGFYIAQKVNEI